MRDFNKKVYQRIKEANQVDKLSHFECEIDPTMLYLSELYEFASFIIPNNYAIIDLGCYMGAQGFLFEDHASYIGVDIYDRNSMNGKAPERFNTKNSHHYAEDICHFLEDSSDNRPMYKDAISDYNDVYVLMGAVPDQSDGGKKTQQVLNTFPNVAITYPGMDPIFKGVYAEDMQYFYDLYRQSHNPYAKSFLREHPDIAEKYRLLEENLDKEISKYSEEGLDIFAGFEIDDIDKELDFETDFDIEDR